MNNVNAFLETLRIQRWDDHRYYHHSRVNQSLHLISAISFLVAYAMVFSDPATAARRPALSARRIGGGAGATSWEL